MDRISLLPDEILGHILSFLPTKQAVSTSLLSKRWRNVFLLVSTLDLHYDDSIDLEESNMNGDILDNRRKFMDFVERLLSRQGKSPIKKLTLKIYHLDRTRVQSWIRNVLERGVVDLRLFYEENNQFLSSLIFKNNTLVQLTLGGRFTINLSQDVYLPKLKTLCLDSVVSDGVLETLLPRCPALEELVVENRLWVTGNISLSSLSLKKLIIQFFSTQTISLDVPNLVYLEVSCFFGLKFVSVNLDSLIEARLNLSLSGFQLQELRLVEARLNLSVSEFQLQELRQGSAHLISADKIDIIIQMRNVRVLHLTSGTLEMFYFSGQQLPKFDNLVRLCISSHRTHGWQILPLLIRNSPNLETLIFKGLEHYKTTNCGDVCVCKGEKSSSCLSSCRVKVLEIWNSYKGSSKELNQIKHFLKKLPCLELVKIKVVNNVNVPKYIRQILKLPRASSNCKIQALC